MQRPYRLVPDTLSHDTIDCLAELLRDARKGEIQGIAFAAMYKGRKYIVNTAGECSRNRTFARGMVSDLHESLGIKDAL